MSGRIITAEKIAANLTVDALLLMMTEENKRQYGDKYEDVLQAVTDSPWTYGNLTGNPHLTCDDFDNLGPN